MARIYTLFLRVSEADEADYGKWVITIHSNDKPEDIEWGSLINISLDMKNWITCKLEPAGDIGVGKIYIGIRQRGKLNKDAVRVQIARVNEPCRFYIRKASSRKAPLYILIGFIGTILVGLLVYFLYFARC